ncbi:MAG: aldose epimerase family protein [Liquorilactobacillus ghanensis]|uniref:aldose epimerase family protein n=1 Tax=Liquorilactobacillus ghanensis TaxID=399370 RepID=UPI0039E96CC8
MRIEKSQIGSYQGQAVYKYKLINDYQNYIEVLSYAVTWHSFVINGKNLLAHFNKLEDYFGTPTYLCQAVGRVAGRISAGKAVLAGEKFQLPQNENKNTLHGGPHGFASTNWPAEVIESETEIKLRFSKKITNEFDGFPNDLNVVITVSFDNLNQVKMTFTGQAEGITIFNPTNHAYFNLNDEQTNLADHWLQIPGNQRLELNQAKLPTGRICQTEQTGYDFSHGQELGAALRAIKQEVNRGELDDAFVVPAEMTQPVAVLTNQATKDEIQIFSNRKGLVVYSADLNSDGIFDALALEAQSLPDAVNHPEWNEDIVLKDGQTKTAEIVYKYSKLN